VTDSLSSENWTIVTVTYNSAAHLRESWYDGPPGAARWIVVDNASTDDTVLVAKELGADVIALVENVGFSAGNNVGLKEVQTRWVAFVNPDVTIHSSRDLERLAKLATANDGFAAPQLLNPDGTEQPNARGLPYPLWKLAHRSLRLPGVDLKNYVRTGFTSPVFVAWVMGAALAGRTEDFRAIGGWDERFFLYYEDHDIGLRAWEAGMPVVVDPLVRWVHGWQRETTHFRLAPWRHEIRSARVFYRRWPALFSGRTAGRSPVLQQIQRSVWRPARNA
jgi:N-acetylglucosaminyl-diphospho-decaprenol L-rhamnosyltransferase